LKWFATEHVVLLTALAPSYACFLIAFLPSLNYHLQFVGILMSFMLLGVSIVQLCALTLTGMRGIITLMHPSERHISCFLSAVGPMVHTSPWYASPYILNRFLTACSLLRLCPGSCAERSSRRTRLRRVVQWLGPPINARCIGLVQRRRPHRLRHAYVRISLLMT
jgi:hypothetical protein